LARERDRQVDDAVTVRRSGRARWAVVALLMALAGISHFNRISMPIAGDLRVMAQYGITPVEMGWIYSAFLITYTACMIPGGWLIDRLGAKAALTAVGLGSALFVALTGAVGLVSTDPRVVYAALLLVRGSLGVISAPLHPACARVVGHWVPPGGRSRANGLVNGAALAGIAATPAVFGVLIAHFDWPAAFLIAGAATAGLGLAWALYATDWPDTTPATAPFDVISGTPNAKGGGPGSTIGWRDLLSSRSLVLLTLSYAAVGYFQYLFFYWMNYYLQRVLELPEQTSGFYAAIPPLAMALGMPLGGLLSDRLERSLGVRWGRRVVPMAALCAGAALLGLGVLAREPEWVVTWFALAMGAVGASEGAYWVTAVELGGRRGGSSAALFNTGGNAGGLLAPVITPWVGQRYGWGWALGLGSLVCCAGVALWLGIDPSEPGAEDREGKDAGASIDPLGPAIV
jgi:ACS family D-galactonate transporter-like MFS transporter